MPASTVSEEISHLVRDKGYPQKRAVAASLNMQRRGKLKRGKRKKKRGGHKRY
jgi:hypothetical protein